MFFLLAAAQAATVSGRVDLLISLTSSHTDYAAHHTEVRLGATRLYSGGTSCSSTTELTAAQLAWLATSAAESQALTFTYDASGCISQISASNSWSSGSPTATLSTVTFAGSHASEATVASQLYTEITNRAGEPYLYTGGTRCPGVATLSGDQAQLLVQAATYSLGVTPYTTTSTAGYPCLVGLAISY